MCSAHATLSQHAGASGEPRAALGRLGEELAAAHFERLGLRVLARNVRTRYGEIDLIACGGGVLVFAEVKTRTSRTGAVAGDRRPLAGLGPRQRRRLRRLAAAWLCQSERPRPGARTIRFDAVGVSVDGRGRLLRLEHIEAAW